MHSIGTGGSTCAPVLPTEPKYSCQPRVTKTGDCYAYQLVGPQLLPPLTYPEGCVVTLPYVNPAYPCVLQTCTCAPSPPGDRGTWVCPI